MALFNGHSNNHVWRFFCAGGTDQVCLGDATDILSLDTLDRKLWMALSCPVKGLEFDSKTLALIDTDKDGRIRTPEIVAAVKWLGARLKDVSEIKSGSAALPLQSIKEDNEEGKRALASARQILINLGKPDAATISVEDTMDTARIFAQTKFNGDGVIPVDSAEDAPTQTVIQNIIDCLGGELDRSGKMGVTQAKMDQFFAELAAYDAWQKAAEKEEARIRPLGDGTEAALQVLLAVKTKVDDYFARCRLAAFDEKMVTVLNRQEADYVALTGKDLSFTASEISGFPLARVAMNKPLPLKEGLNPAWADVIARLESDVIRPILGKKAALSIEEWMDLSGRFAAYQGWMAAKAGGAVEKLGLARVREILAGKSREKMTELIAKDKALESEVGAISEVEQLARYYRDLYQLLNNFVSFADFYSHKRKAIFQAGTLYLDGRACDLCVRVDDMSKHGALASLAKTYLAYCDCVQRGGTEKMTIAAAFTGGDSDQLLVGRNGVFFDRSGRDWDATIVKLIEHPISIRQAFWAPYKKVAKMIEDQLEKTAAARDKAMQEKAAAGVSATAAGVTQNKPTVPQQAFDVGKTVGILAAVGLALGAIGTAAAAILGSFMALPLWQKPIAIAAVMLLISGPSILIAWLKLRQRNLGPILDANGWAVNGRVKINIPFGGALTSVAKLPANAERTLDDPYAEKSHTKTWITLVIVLILAACAAWFWHSSTKKPANTAPQIEMTPNNATNALPAK
jgi:hypothetical protein